MSAYYIKLIAGAIVLAIVVIVAIDFISDAVTGPGGQVAPVAPAPVKKTPAPAPVAPAPVKKAPANKSSKPDSIGSLLASADAVAGSKMARKCSPCHSLNKGGKTKIGPNLWNIVGAGKAGKAGFKYSEDLRAKGGKWTYEDLSAFLKKPRDFAKGTRMLFAGIKKPGQRADLILYLRSLSDSPVPLP